LAQLALRMTAPGVPDVYQGDEWWNLSLVDPDNRRPVDFAHLSRELTELRGGAPPVRANAKLFTTWQLLALRARRAPAFEGAYTPIDVGTSGCCYRRGDDVLVVVPIRPVAMPFRVPPGWRNVLAPLVQVLEHPPAVYEAPA
jgi:(1->4)-alpha-D-glucan 1-alpha-D-glucosylmutase